MQDWRDGFRAALTLSKAFFPFLVTGVPEVIVAVLPIAVVSMLMDMKAMQDHAILELEDGEILVPTKPRVRKLLGYSLALDCLMLAIVSFFMSGYDHVAVANTAVYYGLYLMETSGAKAAVEVFRPEMEQFREIEVKN